MYQHFILIRFSLAFVHNNMNGIDVVLDENRLKTRFDLFERFCLPSLIHQKKKTNVLVLIKITNNLPIHWKERLYSLIKNYNHIKIQEFDAFNSSYKYALSNESLKPYINQNTKLLLTTRLDDDDALHRIFTHHVRRFAKNKYNNKIISYPNGFQYHTNNKLFHKRNYPRIALGLTLVQKINNKKFINGVYSKEHTKWHKYTKCIYPKKIMWVRTMHEQNRSKIGKSKKYKYGSKNLKLIKKKFPHLIF